MQRTKPMLRQDAINSQANARMHHKRAVDALNAGAISTARAVQESARRAAHDAQCALTQLIRPMTLVDMEKAIIRAFVTKAVDMGYTISVNNGEDWEVKLCINVPHIMGVLGATDSDTLVVRRADGSLVGWAFFVYGNSGWDVLSDYADNKVMGWLLAEANALADDFDMLYA